MSVHVGELHTELVTTGALPGTPTGSGSTPGGAPADERAAEERERACRLAARVRAEGFDD